MKKMFLILMAMLMCACSICAAAEEEPVVTDMPVAGLRMTWPEAFTGIRGTVMAYGVKCLDNGIYYAYWEYYAAAPEEARLLIDQESSELKSDKIFYTVSVGEDQEVSEIVRILNEKKISIQAEDLVLIGELDNWKFYLCMTYNPDFAGLVEPEYADEYAALCGMKDEIASSFTFSVPFNEYGDMTNRFIRITGTDLEGRPVSVEELFSEHAISLVNIWATWCPHCLSELSKLEEIYTRNLEKGCCVIGLMVDKDIEEANALISEYGLTYPIVLVPKEFAMIFPYRSYPTTFFVDRNGKFLENKYEGALPEKFEDVLIALLNLL